MDLEGLLDELIDQSTVHDLRHACLQLTGIPVFPGPRDYLVRHLRQNTHEVQLNIGILRRMVDRHRNHMATIVQARVAARRQAVEQRQVAKVRLRHEWSVLNQLMTFMGAKLSLTVFSTIGTPVVGFTGREAHATLDQPWPDGFDRKRMVAVAPVKATLLSDQTVVVMDGSQSVIRRFPRHHSLTLQYREYESKSVVPDGHLGTHADLRVGSTAANAQLQVYCLLSHPNHLYASLDIQTSWTLTFVDLVHRVLSESGNIHTPGIRNLVLSFGGCTGGCAPLPPLASIL